MKPISPTPASHQFVLTLQMLSNSYSSHSLLISQSAEQCVQSHSLILQHIITKEQLIPVVAPHKTRCVEEKKNLSQKVDPSSCVDLIQGVVTVCMNMSVLCRGVDF